MIGSVRGKKDGQLLPKPLEGMLCYFHVLDVIFVGMDSKTRVQSSSISWNLASNQSSLEAKGPRWTSDFKCILTDRLERQLTTSTDLHNARYRTDVLLATPLERTTARFPKLLLFGPIQGDLLDQNGVSNRRHTNYQVLNESPKPIKSLTAWLMQSGMLTQFSLAIQLLYQQ